MNRRTAAAAGAFLLSVSTAPVAHGRGQERHTHHAAAEVSGLGAVSFANSGAAAAQPAFQRGLAFLHSFEYDQAAEAFRAAQTADPSFAMAFWGEALTYSHLLWGEDDADAARGALGRLGAGRDARLAKAGTPRERAFGEAIEALFIDGTLPVRVRGFSDAMRVVALAYPDDLDASSFAALASMFAAYNGDLVGGRAAGRPRCRRRLRAAGVHRQPESSRWRALPDSRLRQPGVGGARARGGAALRADRARGRARAAHALAHLRAARPVARHRGVERAVVGRVGEGSGGAEADQRRPELPRLAVRAVRRPAARTPSRVARQHRQGASRTGRRRSDDRTARGRPATRSGAGLPARRQRRRVVDGDLPRHRARARRAAGGCLGS